MAKRTSRRKGGNTVNVDFEGVDVRVLLPEGMYETTVDEVKLEDNNGKPYLAWKFKTIDDDPKFDGKTLYNNTSLQPQSLWVLASLLDCLGVERPNGPMDLDLEELVGLEVMLQVEHEEYEGKTRAKVVDFMAATDSDGGEEVEVDDDEGEDEGGEGGDGYTEEGIMAMDADELAEVIEENDLKVRKVKKLATMRAKVVEALQEAGLIGEEEDEDEGDEDGDGEEGDLYTESEVMEMSVKDLDALVEEEELEVEKPKRTNKPAGLKKYREAVVEALEEAELLEEEEED